MIQILKELITLIADTIPLFGSIAVVVWLALWLNEFIKKHATVYYWVFGLISLGCFLLVNYTFFAKFLPLEWLDAGAIRKIPLVRILLRNFVHIYGISFPILIVIMYMGALNPKRRAIGKLMRIRKELSIMVGFPVLAHALTRIIHITPSNLNYLFGEGATKATQQNTSGVSPELLMHLAFFIGLFMVVLFLLLWITSFTKIRRALGAKRWKAIQRWSYLFYAFLFIHSVLLRSSWLMNVLAREGNPKEHIVGLASTLIIFISYLVLRLRKAQHDGARRRKNKTLGTSSSVK